MTYRSECTCGCHSNPGMIHIAPCCRPDPTPSSIVRGIRPLVWKLNSETQTVAEVFFGRYIVERNPSDRWCWGLSFHGEKAVGLYPADNFEAAKVAAQADHQQRVMSAFESYGDYADVDLSDPAPLPEGQEWNGPRSRRNHVNGGAYRTISVDEWRSLGGDNNKFCDWHEGIGYVVYDDLALEQYLAKTTALSAKPIEGK